MPTTTLPAEDRPRLLRKLRVTLPGYLAEQPVTIPEGGISVDVTYGEQQTRLRPLQYPDNVSVFDPPLAIPAATVVTVETNVEVDLYARFAPVE